MTFSRRRFLSLTSAALATPALSRTAFAADWPTERAIHAIVPFSAGSTIDIVGRIVTDPVGHQIGQTIVIDNRDSAGVASAADVNDRKRRRLKVIVSPQGLCAPR
jgi:tripartite-type tricarboxylate transporter receptor subunit TctC